MHKSCSLVEVHILQVNVDIEAQQALVLDLSVLGHHQHVFLSDQVLDYVADFLARLQTALERRATSFLQLQMMNQLVNDLCLRD